jgi:hypothetical protein
MAVKTEPYLIQELFSPRVEASEGLFVRDVEHQYARICAAVKCHPQRLKALLPRSIPNLAKEIRKHMCQISKIRERKHNSIFLSYSAEKDYSLELTEGRED